MRFLADESCDFIVVRSLRAVGHEVLAVSEIYPRAEDSFVIDLALKEGRILITEDKDFGQLVFAHGRKTQGIILIRYPSKSRGKLSGDIVNVTKRFGKHLKGNFLTVRPGQVRISRI